MIEDFFMDPVGPYYTGLGAHLGDASVTYIPIDTSNKPLDLNPTVSVVTQQEIPIIPILLLGGIIIYLLLNR